MPTSNTNPIDDYHVLEIYIHDEELKNFYKNKIVEHNQKIIDNKYPDAGFDLYVPEKYTFEMLGRNCMKKLDMGVKCAMKEKVKDLDIGNTWIRNISYYLYPRSSIIKTPLRLANSVGIIDSGYRGNIIGAFDCFPIDSVFYVEKHTRLLQICSPTLKPLFVKLINAESELGSTGRGSGGFGSTGS